MKSKRIFDARQVPEEELAGVRQALDDAGIEYYETSAGNWGLGNAAIWVANIEDREAGRAVVEDFQARWTAQARAQPVTTGVRWSLVPALVFIVALIAWVSWQLGRW